MKILSIYFSRFWPLLMLCLFLFSCEEEEVFPRTRLFQPVLNENLLAQGNMIIVNMGNMKNAVSYSIEVSRDSFITTDYTIETDTHYVEINEALVGEPLFWNTLYQIRVTAHADSPEYDSHPSDLGSVRTDRFPSILQVPESYDVTDVAARVTWEILGLPVTGIRIYSAEDLRLQTPLWEEYKVTKEEQDTGEVIVTGLEPMTEYQIAIYSGEELRGWVNYVTKVPDIDPSGPNVIDLRDNTSPDAVINAVAMAPDGAVILVRRGSSYELPEDDLTKSITIRAAYGFGAQKAKLYTSGNWNIADGSVIDHIRFIDLELRGEDYTGDYIFNPNRDDITVREVSFVNCEIGTVRGIMRIRGTVSIDEFNITDCVVDSIGSYGILTADTNPSDDETKPTAHVNHITLKNSTFNHIQAGITSRNNSQSILLEGCTFANFIKSGSYIFRYRGGDGNNNVMDGIVIRDCIFGRGWYEGETDTYEIKGKDGLENSTIQLTNIYTTQEFGFYSNEIVGFPIGNYSGTQTDLWVDPSHNDFNFKDQSFSGKFDTGDPRWREKL